MARKAKKWTLKSKLISAIRRIWFWSPLRKEALKLAKEGKRYRCSICKELFDKIQIDHKDPIVTEKGFTTWDDYLNRTFCSIDNLQAVCYDCHSMKTKIERTKKKLKSK